MTSPDTVDPSTVTAPPVRLYLPAAAPKAVRACLDGAWWPYSTDLEGQAVELAQVVGDMWQGRVARMTYDPSIWMRTPRKISRMGPALRMGWFRSDEPQEVTLVMVDGRRVDLVAVPPSTSAPRAYWVMRRAVAAGSATHGNELIHMADTRDRDPSAW